MYILNNDFSLVFHFILIRNANFLILFCSTVKWGGYPPPPPPPPCFVFHDLATLRLKLSIIRGTFKKIKQTEKVILPYNHFKKYIQLFVLLFRFSEFFMFSFAVGLCLLLDFLRKRWENYHTMGFQDIHKKISNNSLLWKLYILQLSNFSIFFL